VNKAYSFDYTLYFDAVNANFLFENDLYKRKWEVNSRFLIRVQDIAEASNSFPGDISSVPGYKQSVEDNLLQLKHSFDNYNITAICITGFDIAGVCKIFERINHAGKQLENFDIMVARHFKDNPIVVEET
jgi:hypothetical protein